LPKLLSWYPTCGDAHDSSDTTSPGTPAAVMRGNTLGKDVPQARRQLHRGIGEAPQSGGRDEHSSPPQNPGVPHGAPLRFPKALHPARSGNAVTGPRLGDGAASRAQGLMEVNAVPALPKLHPWDRTDAAGAAACPGMNRDQLRALPATIDLAVAARALGIGRSAAYELVRTDSWPTPVLHLGHRIKIPTEPLLILLGLSTDAQPFGPGPFQVRQPSPGSDPHS
jgi:hypothetical protein